MSSLHSRLLLSYILVLLACLVVIGLAMGLLLARGALPERQVYRDLENKSRWVLFRPVQSAAVLDQPAARLPAVVGRIADTLKTRVLLLEADGRVIADSGDALSGRNLLEEARMEESGPELLRGSFRPAGTLQKWLFVGQPLPSPGEGPKRWFVVSQQVPRLAALQLFGDELFTSLLRAGILGLALSTLLAWLVSRSVARPVQRAAVAAHAIAQGDYDQQLPLSGPAELQELALSFNQMAQQVKAAQQAQRDFVANVSHDLKTPLTSIQGFSQAILDGTAGDPEEARQAAAVIHDEAGRMRRMVDDLLLLARMDAGELRLERQPLDLPQLLANCVSRLELRAREAGIVLALELPPAGIPPFTGDGDRLLQLFGNLLDNALKHTPAGGRVVLSATHADERIVVAVTDTGTGIPPEELSRIFERFYQVDKSRARSSSRGTGLGLAISKELAEAHGGTITAESVVGVGTKFSVVLPTAKNAPTVVRRRS
jgi:signal transduction histidine kinase